MRRTSAIDVVLLLVVLASAGVARCYAIQRAPQAPVVQHPDERVWEYAENIVRRGWFAGPVPLTEPDAPVEKSASLSPGYPYFLAVLSLAVERISPRANDEQRKQNLLQAVQWMQGLMGMLTAGVLYLMARRWFESRAVALVAGLLGAGHHFWVWNTLQLADGVLATFLLTCSLSLGQRLAAPPSPQSAEGAWRKGLTAFLFALALGGLALTRASMLVFAWAAVLWVIWKLRLERRGWLWSLLVLVVLVATLAPWTIRNYHLFSGRLVPISTRLGLDLWWGNNDDATGGLAARPVLGEPPQLDMTERLPPGRRRELARQNEAQRFDSLLRQAVDWIRANPGRFAALRLKAAVYSYTGQRMWLGEAVATEPAPPQMAELPRDVILENGEGPAANTGRPEGENPAAAATPPTVEMAPQVELGDLDAPMPRQETPEPDTAAEGASPPVLPAEDPAGAWVLVLMGIGALAGMRWSYRWRERQGLLTLALVTGSLPWILTHADVLQGPRLPLDGILLLYCALVLGCLIPGVSGHLRGGPAR